MFSSVRRFCYLGNEVEQRSKPRLKFKDSLKKIGMAIMMAPVVIQV